MIKYGIQISGGVNGEDKWLLGTRIGPTNFPVAVLFDTEKEAREYKYDNTNKIVRVEITEIMLKTET